jgi:RNA polymerase sigma-70 factor (ECF subfamily)
MPGSNGEDAGSPASLLLHHIRRLGRGAESSESFRFVYQHYYDRVRGFFSNRGHPVEEARELSQDTFIRVYRGRGVFESTDDFKAWLFQIALNVHRNSLRARHTAKRHAPEDSLDQWIEERGEAPAGPEEDQNPSPLDDFLDRELKVVVARGLKELPPKMRRCYLLSLHQEWTYREVAEHLEISEGTVKAHVFQARRKLDELIAPYLGRRGPRAPGEAGP